MKTRRQHKTPIQTDLFGPPKKVRCFAVDAPNFLRRFTKRQKGRSFSSEDVIQAAEAKGIQPHDKRAWGAIFSQAARENVIVRDYTHIVRKTMSNGSMGLGWKPMNP